MSHLLEFYGEECPHCKDMHKLVVKLEKEEGIKVEALEVWHNEENEKRLLVSALYLSFLYVVMMFDFEGIRSPLIFDKLYNLSRSKLDNSLSLIT
jgi:thiol-disulfide isomerase/thioredoxin